MSNKKKKPGGRHVAAQIQPTIQIIGAHDILDSILAGEIPSPWNMAHNEAIASARDVLCWVLGHRENRHFAENLAFLIEFLEGEGIRFEIKKPADLVGDRPKRRRRSGKGLIRNEDEADQVE
jgi:hypothetical protein